VSARPAQPKKPPPPNPIEASKKPMTVEEAQKQRITALNERICEGVRSVLTELGEPKALEIADKALEYRGLTGKARKPSERPRRLTIYPEPNVIDTITKMALERKMDRTKLITQLLDEALAKLSE
jgi:hypothetical protein